jgi:sensor histidine kinase YesM
MFGKRWIRHIIFWVLCLLAMTVYFVGSEYGKLLKMLTFLIIAMPVFITYSYLSLYVVIPRGFKSGKFFYVVAYFVFGSILFSILYILNANFIYYRFFSPSYYLTSGILDYKIVAYNIIWINIPFLMFGSAKVLRDYLVEVKKKNEMESKNIEAELSLLATQLHPHFLFNTLNNLYSLSLSGSPKTAISLQKIKGLMVYMLYECGQPEISIKKEINLIDDYLELEKLRYDKRLKLTFINDVKNNELLIAPMILFTFVENCFKHGSSKATGSSSITINLSTTEDNDIIFVAENSIPDVQNLNKTEHEGLGLENVKKRLSFLYPERHTLEITKENKLFKVNLLIKNLNISFVKPERLESE